MIPVMRGMIHTAAKRAIFIGLGAGLGSTILFYFGYVQPRQKKYEEYFANYDPYTRMREICEAGKGYMHTCPQELAKIYEEKGLPIAPKFALVASDNNSVIESVTDESANMLEEN